jgi:hypothetical protein
MLEYLNLMYFLDSRVMTHYILLYKLRQKNVGISLNRVPKAIDSIGHVK